MTTLGIDITDKEPVTGWEAIQPKHQPACELVVRLAEDRLAEAWEKYDKLMEEFHGENPDALTYSEYMVIKDKLLLSIEHAKNEHENACTARAAYYQAQRVQEQEPDCTCLPELPRGDPS